MPFELGRTLLVKGITRTAGQAEAGGQESLSQALAATMFVTGNTAQTHIQHILRKLGVRSRTELDALLLRPQTSRAHQQLQNRVGPVSLPGFPPAIRLNITDSGDC
jgi:hypothetical protein